MAVYRKGISYTHQVVAIVVKDHSMIETAPLKKVVIFMQTILSLELNYKYLNDIARKYGNVTFKDFRKYEKLE